jgi:glutaconate CoA-transferase subunit A
MSSCSASKCVIVTVEEIVEEETIRKDPSRTIIPGFLVDAVVHVPYGAHPSGMYKYYDYDAKHIDTYVGASRSKESMLNYFNEYVYGSENELEYLKKIGINHLLKLRADPYFGYSLKTRGAL